MGQSENFFSTCGQFERKKTNVCVCFVLSNPTDFFRRTIYYHISLGVLVFLKKCGFINEWATLVQYQTNPDFNNTLYKIQLLTTNHCKVPLPRSRDIKTNPLFRPF